MLWAVGPAERLRSEGRRGLAGLGVVLQVGLGVMTVLLSRELSRSTSTRRSASC